MAKLNEFVALNRNRAIQPTEVIGRTKTMLFSQYKTVTINVSNVIYIILNTAIELFTCGLLYNWLLYNAGWLNCGALSLNRAIDLVVRYSKIHNDLPILVI
ncbi:hypothetical protein BLOT_011368 [Blomia tropicalis]|nr:hypothetical protein BLOT_011368 [Blomia tropicalis]